MMNRFIILLGLLLPSFIGAQNNNDRDYWVKEMIKMELKYTKTGDYELPNLTLNDNKKGAINKYGMLRLDYLKTHKKALYTTHFQYKLIHLI